MSFTRNEDLHVGSSEENVLILNLDTYMELLKVQNVRRATKLSIY